MVYASIGDIFSFTSDTGTKDFIILAQVAPFMVAAVSLTEGNRWCEAVKVEHPLYVTPEEVSQIMGHHKGSDHAGFRLHMPEEVFTALNDAAKGTDKSTAFKF